MSLSSLLQAATALLSTDDDRITRAYAALDVPAPPLDDQHLDAACCALEILHRVQLVLDADPTVGTRDLSLLRALLSLLFQYGISPLSSLADVPALYSMLSSLFSTLFPRGLRAQPAQTLITTTVLHRHVPDLLRASMSLAWLPKSRWPHESPSIETLRPFVLRLLEFLPLSQIMSDLGAVLSGSPLPHVRKLCSSLLTKSLLRPGGVRALFIAVFGDQESSENLQLEKYERTATILMIVPAGLNPEEYFSAIVPRLIDFLSNDAPAPYRRTASFTISRMLDLEFSHRTLVSSLMSPIIHHPFTRDPNVDASQSESPSAALSILIVLLRNTDPSPIFIAQVLSPIVPALYALSYHLDSNKASDPVLKESMRGLLATWGRVIEAQDGVDTLWSVIQNEQIHWEVDITGNITRGVPDEPTNLALLTPEDIGKEEEISTENFLGLFPDPIHFVQYIRSLDRLDMGADLFVRLLEAYHLAGNEIETDPSRALVYLQIIVQIQTRLCDDSSPTNILSKPDHILSFVKHALGFQVVHDVSPSVHKTKDSHGLGLEDLKIVDTAEHFDDSDSDDEPVELGNDHAENDITSTAIKLLLAILEANPDLSARKAPVLNEIFSLLEPLSSSTSEMIRSLAREARMVMTVRLASSSTSWSAPRRREEEDPRETYQKALKLLQDPILPVRAHGLLLLRQLVSSRPRDTTPKADPLIPAILSIFMQSVQDDDSYIFLNAVQGLSAMVDVFGRDVLGNLLETYTRNLSASSAGSLSKPEVDAKVRVGEALGQVIRRCGDALGIYADIIVPKLISVFRSSYVPTVLRTSAISLLGQCVKTSRVSVLGYLDDLAESMIDFLQVEMAIVPKEDGKGARKVEAEQGRGTETLDSNPATIDSTLAPMRRAGLHFWTTFLGQLTLATYDGDVVEKLPAALLRRARVTLGYIATTDQDTIVRVMAREASEAIDQLHKAMLCM